MKTTPMYVIRGLRHSYGRDFTLEVPSLTLDRGRAYGFVGPNGSGKSTLLRTLAFLEPPQEGEVILFDGIEHTGTGRASVTMLLQDSYLLKRTVFDNVAYGLRAHGIRKNLRSVVHEALRMTGLDPDIFSHRKWFELSGGEAQRVALAARLALEPDVLILDEPTASVDRLSAQVIRETITRVRREYETTLLIASHDLIWLHEVCDEILKMQEGCITGTGEENVLAGPWSPGLDGLWNTKLADGQLIRALPPPARTAAALLDPTSIIVTTERPDHLSAQNVLAGRIRQMYTIERSERVACDILVSDLTLTCSITRTAARTLGLVPGLEVWVVFKASSLRWR